MVDTTMVRADAAVDKGWLVVAVGRGEERRGGEAENEMGDDCAGQLSDKLPTIKAVRNEKVRYRWHRLLQTMCLVNRPFSY